MNNKKINWSIFRGWGEERVEQYLLKNTGSIPESWDDPQFRDEVTGILGQSEIAGQINFGEQAYGDGRLGENDVRSVYYKRNVDGQGHPAIKDGDENISRLYGSGKEGKK
jgi:hypothetical protein